MPLVPGSQRAQPRRSVECATCGDRAEWQGRVWRCKAGHETSERDFPMGTKRGRR